MIKRKLKKKNPLPNIDKSSILTDLDIENLNKILKYEKWKLIEYDYTDVYYKHNEFVILDHLNHSGIFAIMSDKNYKIFIKTKNYKDLDFDFQYPLNDLGFTDLSTTLVYLNQSRDVFKFLLKKIGFR